MTAYLREPLIIIAFGKRLRYLRQEAGLSQEELADRAGIAVSQVGRIERGKLNLSISTMSALARALNILPKELLDSAGFERAVQKKKPIGEGVLPSPHKKQTGAIKSLVKKKSGADGSVNSPEGDKEKRKKEAVPLLKEKLNAVKVLVKKKLHLDGEEMSEEKAKKKIKSGTSAKKKKTQSS